MGVASVVRDYIEEMPATLGQDVESQQQKVGLCTNIPVLWRSIEAFFCIILQNQHCIWEIYDSLWVHRNFLAVSQQISIVPNIVVHKRQIMYQVVLLAGNPWAAGSDVDKLQEATQKINHSIIGVIHAYSCCL